MRQRSRRQKSVQNFRHQPGSFASPQAGAGDEEDLEPIVVHVHVHRSGAERPAARKPAPRAARPVLTGKLFDWYGHYDVVAKHHLEVGRAVPTLWTALAATFRQGRALVVALGTFVWLRRG